MNNNMNIIEIEINKLIFPKYNPRKKLKPDDKEYQKIKNSIEEFGYTDLVIINKDNTIISGNQRTQVLMDMGYKKIKVVQIDIDKTKEKALNIALNKITGEWDYSMLGDLLLELDSENYDLELTGFDLDEIEEIMAPLGIEEEKEVIEDDFDCTPPEEPKAKYGDIYQLGKHFLMCGDSTKEEDVAKLMNGNKADMVLSDPPYGMFLDTDFSDIKGSMKSIGRKNHTSGNKYEKVIGDNEDFKPDLIMTFFDNFNYCKEMFLFGGDYFAELLPNKNDGSWLVWDKRKESQANAIGSEFELIWSKNKHKRRMLRHDWFDFLSSKNQQDARNRVHPTQKPITLLVDIINQWGDNCNNIIDLYGGSGSTLIACEQLNRNCYMMELDCKYIQVIIERYIAFTGNKVYRLNDDGTKTDWEDIKCEKEK